MEAEANRIFDEIDSLGGVIPAIEAGYFQREIADAAYRYQRELENKEKFVVGVNEFVEENEKIDIPILQISEEVEKRQVDRLTELKRNRDNAAAEASIAKIKEAALSGANLMPVLVEAAENYVTLGEMVGALKEHFGVYEESVVF
jgi:methylmalonyl-CoA mutase N-terminal domain/subunit